jgi:pimeloyl-ACP methyl ester carboxylesterase
MQTQFLDHEGGQIAYDDSGPQGSRGPLVLCVPGMGALRREFRFLIPQLTAAGYRVVTMDVRGHGESSTRWPDYWFAGVGSDMLALARSLGAGQVTIVGHSMAAGAAIWAAARAPQLVHGIVLIGATAPREQTRLSRLLYSLLFTLLFARPWGPTVWQWFYGTLYGDRKPADFDAYRAALRANLAEPERMEALVRMMRAAIAPTPARASQINTPSLVIMGSQDPEAKNPAAEAQTVAEPLRAQVKMVEGAGHYPQAEQPDATGALILDFLQTMQLVQEKVYAA